MKHIIPPGTRVRGKNPRLKQNHKRPPAQTRSYDVNYPQMRFSRPRIQALGNAYVASLACLKQVRRYADLTTQEGVTMLWQAMLAVEALELTFEFLGLSKHVKLYTDRSVFDTLIPALTDRIRANILEYRKKSDAYENDSDCSLAKRLVWQYYGSGQLPHLLEEAQALHLECANVELERIKLLYPDEVNNEP